MRRRTTPIAWPRYDPKHYRFTMPNAIWEYSLKPIEFLIFSYLCYYGSAGIPAPEMIASGVHMTLATVKKYLSSLTAKGLINEDGTPALKCEETKFFTLPNEIFLLQLSPSAFMVYAYLLLIEDCQSHTCHPSYNTIAAVTGISKNTVMKSISTLLETGLVTVEPSSYFDKHGLKWKGNNLYTILPIGVAMDVFYQRQLRRLEVSVAKQEADTKLSRLCAAQESPLTAGQPTTPPTV